MDKERRLCGGIWGGSKPIGVKRYPVKLRPALSAGSRQALRKYAHEGKPLPGSVSAQSGVRLQAVVHARHSKKWSIEEAGVDEHQFASKSVSRSADRSGGRIWFGRPLPARAPFLGLRVRFAGA